MSGYAFVPFPDRVSRRPRPETDLSRRVPGTYSGVLHVTYVTREPVHVGSGSYVVLEKKLARAAAREDRYLVVPGSSFKGTVRARFEAMTRSCVARPLDENKVDSRSRGKIAVSFSPSALAEAVFNTCKVDDRKAEPNLCPACALFGVESQRGRVAFTSLRAPTTTQSVLKRVPQRYIPRPHHVGDFQEAGRKLVVTRLYGRKFAQPGGLQNKQVDYLEIIPPDTTLTGQISVVNLSDVELGGLLAAIGRLPRSSLRFGGAKAYGLGHTDLAEVNAQLRDARGRRVEANEEEWANSFRASYDCFADGVGAVIRMHPRSPV